MKQREKDDRLGKKAALKRDMIRNIVNGERFLAENLLGTMNEFLIWSTLPKNNQYLLVHREFGFS